MTERNYELSNLMGDLLRAGEDSATAYERGRSTVSADEDAKKAMRAIRELVDRAEVDRAALALTLATMAVTDETGRVYTGKAAWNRMESERDFYRREVVRLHELLAEDKRMDTLRAPE